MRSKTFGMSSAFYLVAVTGDLAVVLADLLIWPLINLKTPMKER